MLDVQPDIFISRERTSNTRGHADEQMEPLPIDPLLAAYHNGGVHPFHVDGASGPPIGVNYRPITAEQAMEADAARALEELALNRGPRMMVPPYIGSQEGERPPSPNRNSANQENGRGSRSRSARSHSATSPRSSEETPFSSAGSVAADDDADGSDDPDQATDDMATDSPHGTHSRNPLAGSSRPNRNTNRKQRSGAPIPVPFLTKPSRGRRVPTASAADATTISTLAAVTAGQALHTEEENRPVVSTRGVSGKRSLNAAEVAAKIGASSRAYVCAVDGCGKAFRRGEHLKRHVRSLHTHEKRRYAYN